jgi:uncharacterized protein YigE (DUF2233 family)
MIDRTTSPQRFALLGAKILSIALVCLAAVALWARSVAAGSSEQIAIEWNPLGEDLQHARITLGSGGMFSSELDLIRTSLTKLRIGVIRASEYGFMRATVRTLCEKSKALACINSNFFDESGKPLGLIVSRDMTLQTIHRGGKTLTGIFQVTRAGISIVNRFEFDPRNVLEAVQAGPRLLAQGAPVPGLRESSSHSRRSGICIDTQGRMLFYFFSAGLFGLSLDDLRDLLVSENIGCKDALNLDGGGSAQLYVAPVIQRSNDQPQLYREGSDEVPVALGLFLKGNFP